MRFDRRTFMSGSLAMTAAGTLPVFAAPPTKPLNILMLGGTGFLGPHTVSYALDRGHEVTLFNRGRTNSDLFPGLRKLVGDRDPNVDAGLSALQDGRWDAVIDTSGYVPRAVEASSPTRRISTFSCRRSASTTTGWKVRVTVPKTGREAASTIRRRRT